MHTLQCSAVQCSHIIHVYYRFFYRAYNLYCYFYTLAQYMCIDRERGREGERESEAQYMYMYTTYVLHIIISTVVYCHNYVHYWCAL